MSQIKRGSISFSLAYALVLCYTLLFTLLLCHICKMATHMYEVFCVLQIAKSEFVISIQPAVRLKFNYDPLVAKTSAHYIGNLKRLSVFVHGKLWNFQKCLYRILTASKYFPCAVIWNVFEKEFLNFTCHNDSVGSFKKAFHASRLVTFYMYFRGELYFKLHLCGIIKGAHSKDL